MHTDNAEKIEETKSSCHSRTTAVSAIVVLAAETHQASRDEQLKMSAVSPTISYQPGNKFCRRAALPAQSRYSKNARQTKGRGS